MSEPILRSARFLAADYMQRALREGDIAVDATMGNGHDTERLARLVGPTGRVYAFDIQEQAVAATAKRLEQAGLSDRVTLIRASHADMRLYISGTPRLVSFNLGFLPGGDKRVTTMLQSTMPAVETAMDMLGEGGLLVLCCYPGHAEGARELAALTEYLSRVPPRRFNCLMHQFINAGEGAPVCFIAEKQP